MVLFSVSKSHLSSTFLLELELKYTWVAILPAHTRMDSYVYSVDRVFKKRPSEAHMRYLHKGGVGFTCRYIVCLTLTTRSTHI